MSGYDKEAILEFFNQQQIPYEKKEHKAVFTMEEMQEQRIMECGRVCKNLFLRNNNGKKHFVVSVSDDKKVDLKKLGEQLNEKLSFASEKRLQKYLGVTHGAVSPLGVLNDESNSVVVILDKDIMRWEKIGVHPNDNTATVWLTPQDLEKVLRESGNLVEIKEL